MRQRQKREDLLSMWMRGGAVGTGFHMARAETGPPMLTADFPPCLWGNIVVGSSRSSRASSRQCAKPSSWQTSKRKSQNPSLQLEDPRYVRAAHIGKGNSCLDSVGRLGSSVSQYRLCINRQDPFRGVSTVIFDTRAIGEASWGSREA